jgi:endoglucanase
MAYTLLLAADAWNEPAYRAQALGLLPHIWDDEVARLGDRLVLLPGPWALHESPVRFNPSYVLPFALRRFAEEDPERAWAELLHDSYDLLNETLSPQGLSPDWAWLDPLTGRVVATPSDQAALSNFGFEAFRVPWNLAADLAWHQEPRARALLDRMAPLAEEFKATGALPAVRTPQGQPVESWDYLGLYGCLLPAWGQTDPVLALRLLEDVIEPSLDGRTWGDPSDYYAQNLLWLGLALHRGGSKLPGLL